MKKILIAVFLIAILFISGCSVYRPLTNKFVIEPEKELNQEQLENSMNVILARFNYYGLKTKGIVEGGKIILKLEEKAIEKQDSLEKLLKQNKFEAKVGNDTVFKGGNDLTYVCRSADCSGIDPMVGCEKKEDRWICRFMFAISISEKAGQRQADATKDLEVITENGEEYLSEKLKLYLDDEIVDELWIGTDLKGKSITDIVLSGFGAGENQQQAIFDSLENMKILQTILITGSLYSDFKIISTEEI